MKSLLLGCPVVLYPLIRWYSEYYGSRSMRVQSTVLRVEQEPYRHVELEVLTYSEYLVLLKELPQLSVLSCVVRQARNKCNSYEHMLGKENARFNRNFSASACVPFNY
jgi:hypothetical protein